MHKKKYLAHPWIDPRLVVGESKINGKGIFTTKPIKEGELVMIWGGVLIPRENTDWDKYRLQTMVPISDTEYIGLPITDTEDSIDEFLNHSCDPNTWLSDEVTVIARRDIEIGEEITMDQALWNDDLEEDYSDNQKCTCGSSDCRKILTGQDWMRPEIQQKYAGHFSPFISLKIKNQLGS